MHELSHKVSVLSHKASILSNKAYVLSYKAPALSYKASVPSHKASTPNICCKPREQTWQRFQIFKARPCAGPDLKLLLGLDFLAIKLQELYNCVKAL